MAKKIKNLHYYEAVGRRKESVARVRLYLTTKEKSVTVNNKKIGKGQIFVNGRPFEEIFTHKYQKQHLLKPLLLTSNDDRFAISIVARGGGQTGQLDAITHGIARALCLVDNDEYKPVLKREGLLTRDPRTRERRKVGTGGKARRAKQSPKR
jgi:small subunit ribosomal protein S9